MDSIRQRANHHEIIKDSVTAWSVWRNINECAFRQKSPAFENTSHNINQLIVDWTSERSQTQHIRATSNGTGLPIIPPPSPFQHELFCDGSFIEEDPVAAYGVIIKDSHERVCNGSKGQFPCSSPFMAEVMALLKAIEFEKDSGLRTIIKSDCLTLIRALIGREEMRPCQCYALIGRMRAILSLGDRIICSFIPRRLNGMADMVEKSCRCGSLPPIWIQNLM
ncbi:hypothetical protein LINGRAHAP2_LOCUS34369 [Linum grandiflorum]